MFKKVLDQKKYTIDKVDCYGCLVNQIIQYGTQLFVINRNIFRYLKMEIALAIPASHNKKSVDRKGIPPTP